MHRIAHCRNRLAIYKDAPTKDIVKELPRNAMAKLLERELREARSKERERNV